MQTSNKQILRAAALVVFCLTAEGVAAWGQSMQCNTVGLATAVRVEGYTERLGDVLLYCTGGTPTPEGQLVPQVDIKITLNLNVTSKVTGADTFTEALLLVDEPNSYSLVGPNLAAPQHPVLNCGHFGAPDKGPAGGGVCAIAGTGDTRTVYDGNPNSFGGGACDGGQGHPRHDSYGCGRPNVFQGQLLSGDPSSIIFRGVPVDPPGQGAFRHLRITNLRVDATNLPPCVLFCDAIFALVSFPSGGDIVLSTAFGEVGVPINGVVAQVTSTGDLQHNATLHLVEGTAAAPGTLGNASAWKAKNLSFIVGDNSGTKGNALSGLQGWVFSGSTNYPDDIAQNVAGTAGTLYPTESGFEWTNDTANGPPFPNPPQWLTVFPGTSTDLGQPLDSFGYRRKTGISKSGVANAGTRIALSFSKEKGYSVQVPRIVFLHSTTNPGANSGVMVLTDTNKYGAGAFSAVNGDATVDPGKLAVYEVLYATGKQSNSQIFRSHWYTRGASEILLA